MTPASDSLNRRAIVEYYERVARERAANSNDRAMPQAARAAAPSGWSLLRVSSVASIAIAVFCVVYFGLQLLRGVL